MVMVTDLDQLKQLAAIIVSQIKPGDVLALEGAMGAGKTTFTQALAAALGITEPVTSPTFTLIHQYHSGRHPLTHVDFYRLGPERAESLRDELMDDLEAASGILIAEWASFSDFIQPWVNYKITFSTEPNKVQSNANQRQILWETVLR